MATATAGWIGLALNHESFRTVYHDRVLPLRQLKAVSDMYAVNVVDAAERVRDGSRSWDDGVASIDRARAEVARQWAAYLATYLTPEETALASQADTLMRRADASVARLKALMAARDAPGLDAYVSHELYPAVDPVTAKIEELVDLQRRVAAVELAHADRVFAATRWIEGVLMLLGLAAATAGIWVTIGGVTRPLGAMTAVMARIAARDIPPEVPALGRTDEIGQMARAVEVLRQASLTNEHLADENRQQRLWLERLLDELPVGITIFDKDRRLMARNSAMNRLHPHPDPKRLMGVTLDGLVREIAVATDVPEGRRESFVHNLSARYQAAREGQFETKFGHGTEVNVYFRWIDDQYLVLVHTDISELRAAERRAVEAEQKMRNIIESLPISVVLFDEQERFVLSNHWAAADLPMRSPLIAGETKQADILHESPPDEVTTANGNTARGHEAATLALEQYRSQAQGAFAVRRGDRHLAVGFRNIPGLGRVMTATDVTDLARARRTAQESEARLRTAVAEIPISFSLFSQDQRLVLFNEEFRREFRTVADIIRPGMTSRELVAAYFDASERPTGGFGDQAEWRRAKADVANRDLYVDRLAQTFFNWVSYPLDVERDYGSYRLRQVELPNGEFVRVSADITDLRQKEAEIRRLGESALAQRTAILQEILDTIPQALAVVGGDRRLRFGNLALCKLLGQPSHDEPTFQLAEIFSTVGLSPSAADRLFSGGTQEMELASPDHRPLRVRAVPIPTGDTLVTVTDLSEQRQAEADRLVQQQRVLEAEKSQAILTLAGTVAHDFNNLLAVILGFSSIAAAAAKKVLDASALPSADAHELADVASSLEKVVVSAERGRNVVASLNALSHERQATVGRLDLGTVVKDVEQLVRVLVPASIRIDLELPRTPCRVIANATQIEQIVTNLCVNAVHAFEGKAGRVAVGVDVVDVDGGRAQGLRVTEAAVHRGGSHVEVAADGSVSVFVGVLGKGRHACLRVDDNGRGMTVEVARKIFTPFFTTKAPGVGTGLGLSSVVEIVAAHQGGLHVRTKPDLGTSFMVFFPLVEEAPVRAEPAAPQLHRLEPLPDADIRTETRILVVDDEVLLADLAANVLRRVGYEVETFTDPAAALDRFKSDPFAFDVIVTDQTMPGMTGLELIERVRALRPDVPIIICTGHLPEVERNGALPAGIRRVLRKPYSPGDLANLVRETLAQTLPAAS